MSRDPLRVYFDPAEIGADGYPHAWHFPRSEGGIDEFNPPIKDLIRGQAGNRCERCGHPYEKGMGEWSRCDEYCTHGGPVRRDGEPVELREGAGLLHALHGLEDAPPVLEAQWRILTVHHLNRVKHDLRWWNLAALCQRCHLTIQGKVWLDRPYDRPHTPWFRPHAAGYYASDMEPEPSREWVMEHIDEILDRHATQATLL